MRVLGLIAGVVLLLILVFIWTYIQKKYGFSWLDAVLIGVIIGISEPIYNFMIKCFRRK